MQNTKNRLDDIGRRWDRIQSMTKDRPVKHVTVNTTNASDNGIICGLRTEWTEKWRPPAVSVELLTLMVAEGPLATEARPPCIGRLLPPITSAVSSTTIVSISESKNARWQLTHPRVWTFNVGLIVTVSVPTALHNFTLVFTRWTGSKSDTYAVR